MRGRVQGYNQDGSYLLYQWKNPADASALDRVLQRKADPLRVDVWPKWPAHFSRFVEPEREEPTPKVKAPHPVAVPQPLMQAAPPIKALPPKLRQRAAAAAAAGASREQAAPQVKPPPAVPMLSLKAVAPAHSESGACPPQGFELGLLPPPAQLALQGAEAGSPPAAKIGKAKAGQDGMGPPMKSPPLGRSVFLSGNGVQPGDPAALLKGPWLAP